MRRVLHLLNGESIEPAWRAAGLPGTAFAWGEMLMDGPVSPDLASVRDERARWFEAQLGVPRADALAASVASVAALDATGKEDAVVLWFEQDLFCQVNLAYALTRLGATGARAELVLPDQPLGPRAAGDLARLFEARTRVDGRMVLLASRFWGAYAGPDPERLAALRTEDLSAWPGLARAVDLALARFPARDGLDVVDRATLRALGAGAMTFKALFRAVTADPAARGLGIADAQFAMQLKDLAHHPEPLVRIEGSAPLAWRLSATPSAFAALHGRADVVRTRGIDRWRGGVRLTGRGPVWRWDGRALAQA